MNCTCGCCAGAHVMTPASEENRPGLRRIDHRPGTYATFFETMHARLSSSDFPELAALHTRDPGDASIALCDAWAITADVLSFYQRQIANEGYLRTATERNSLLQLGRLTGYELRPGVSASTYVAYTIDANAGNADIPVGTRIQSVPGTGEKMQTFETAEPLSARAEWSEIAVRLSQPQWRAPQAIDATTTLPDYGDRYNVLASGNALYLDGINTQLQPNDALLIDYGDAKPTPYRVERVEPDADNRRTKVTLRAWSAQASGAIAPKASAGVAGIAAAPEGDGSAQSRLSIVVGELNKAAAQPLPRSALTLPREISTTLRQGGEAFSRLLLTHVPALRETIGPALRSANVTTSPPLPIKVYALRTKAGLFGDSAPNQIVFVVPQAQIQKIAKANAAAESPPYPGNISYNDLSVNLAWADELDASIIPLNAVYDRIKPGNSSDNPSWIIVDAGVTPNAEPQVMRVQDVRTVTMSIGSAVAAQVTQLTVDPTAKWRDNTKADLGKPDLLRQARVYAESEPMTLAADPLTDNVEGDVTTNEIELDKYYGGLTAGMWVIAGGERADFTDPDVKVGGAERAMIAAVRHGLTPLIPIDPGIKPANLPGDTVHTFIKLATPLTYSYRRATFTLHGNVARATHGQTNRETLGSGDATQVFQQFTLKSPPLTYVSAPTPAGISSTLQVRANNLLWHETDDLGNAAPNARTYRTSRDDGEATSIVFGDGKHGARVPTGAGNVAAVYRSGIGAAGNVRAGQLTLLADKPLGVTAVVNPIRASGGADPDTLAQARTNAPLSVAALDRLVSIRDYADFACVFAGVGKAASTHLPGPGGDFVHVTIAGIDDAPIDTTSDLYVNLDEALHAFGDPHLQIRLDVRTALSLVVQATVALQPDYAWNDVQPKIQAALLAGFGFQARAFGQPVLGSEIIATIQCVTGVAHVLGGKVALLDYDDLVLGLAPLAPGANATAADAPPASWFSLSPAIGATDEGDGAHGWLAIPAASIGPDGTIHAAQIAYLPANVPDALILQVAS